jgi:predicted PurR-regulated permease PerM
MTISAINAVVGLATGGMMWLCGVADPVLWGFTAFVLNFVPILGPLLGVVLFVLVGMLSLGAHWAALLPAALYFAIHLVEGDMVTPQLLARRFTINPVALVLGLVFWYWMWGIPGAVLAVPMLAITKIVCDDIPTLRAFGHFLEG